MANTALQRGKNAKVYVVSLLGRPTSTYEGLNNSAAALFTGTLPWQTVQRPPVNFIYHAIVRSVVVNT